MTVSLDADALAEINRLRTIARVVSNTAHDVNNSLQVVSGSSELLAMRTAIGAPEKKRLETIGTQAGRAATIIERMSGYTRVTPGRQRVDLAQVVDVAVALRDYTLHRAHITVMVERPPAPCTVMADRNRILQVLLNLLLNVEAALADRKDGAVTVTLAEAGGLCRVTVVDNGPGIAADVRAKVADAGTVPAPGADLQGIGLWVSARIADAHQGRLEIGDAAGGGASVALVLPA